MKAITMHYGIDLHWKTQQDSLKNDFAMFLFTLLTNSTIIFPEFILYFLPVTIGRDW